MPNILVTYMNKLANPLTLSVLQVNAYSTESTMGTSFPAVDMFDDRKDFSMRFNLKGIAVLMVFFNERSLSSGKPKGVRRRVSVSMVDATDNRIMATRTIKVAISKDHYAGTYRSDFNVTYGDIESSHKYLIILKDEATGVIYGEKEFHLFDELSCGCYPEEWYKVESGGIIPHFSKNLFKTIDGEIMTWCKVRFNLVPDFRQMPSRLPEVELRIYFSNGTMASRFIVPECEDKELDLYFVEHAFLINTQNKGVSYAELICMDFAVAGFVFSTSEDYVRGHWWGEELKCLDEFTPIDAVERLRDLLKESDKDSEEDCEIPDGCTESDEDLENRLQEFIASSLDRRGNEKSEGNVGEESALKPLEGMIGLKSVKEKLLAYEKMVRFNKLRVANGLPAVSSSLHAMFLGSPGTGKTTVAHLMGEMLKKAGLLSKGHVIVRERATLLGPNYSMEETNTLKAVEEAQGGILFIDEAYQLYQPEDKRDPGRFVIETLLSVLSDESKRDWMLILAGYPQEMKRMFELNPGFKSRIPDSNIYMFEDFKEDELLQIAENYLNNNRYSLSEGARAGLIEKLGLDYSRRDKRFGNARHVINLIQSEILPAMAVRVIAQGVITEKTLSVIQASDIPSTSGVNLRKTPLIGFRA